MTRRFLATLRLLATLVAAVALALTPAAGQSQALKNWTHPETPWGDPDLQGVYTSDDSIGAPLQRPEQFGERRYLTDEEYAERAKQAAAREATLTEEFAGDNPRITINPQGHWLEWGDPSRQTSLVVDPPNGRIPALTPEGLKRWEAVQATRRALPAGPEDRPLYDRCITRGVTGSIFPVIYGNGTQIFQAPGYVAITHEMIHEARIIPLDGRGHLSPAIRSYMGDSRGRWDGNTLVIETTNFTDKTGVGLNGSGTVHSEDLKLVERFTRVAEDRINYEIAIDDPKTWTAQWTVAFPIVQKDGYEIFEYACHEGNYGLHNLLSAARTEEATAKAQK
jgi:hypothetical protein